MYISQYIKEQIDLVESDDLSVKQWHMHQELVRDYVQAKILQVLAKSHGDYSFIR